MRSALLIMAKAPIAGAVKTRLAPLLGDARCAELQGRLIRHTVDWAVKAADVTSLAYAPADAGEALAALVPPAVALFPQRGVDLGARLRAACADVAGRDVGPVAVVGTDAPLLGPSHVRAAFAELENGADACLIPAHDGGYVLIALAIPHPAAFDIPVDAWGGSDVFALTLAALTRAGLRAAVLPALPDLDTPADALALRQHPGCPPALQAVLA
ncbi:TIGR04282 family arsenosugar biosynthesis glycosyltransferase [Conexibacter sp. DBS9H8]|uniref:TIGR04282 family arsenosugar biosynthesis glycosyltransferase n=1 Tax=Conexibacter sp. DBS9H8 TaxID=2937801 RepID=UPI00200D4640|nr:TIGR04282 family arsenosugar biosynthesis glycosyltransferase [Conexibacter sp. DBS9H8]